jgi:magnesium-transporting ATPase (P-type)
MISPGGPIEPVAEARYSQGLTSEEAQRRLASYGPNEILEATPNPFALFLRKF